jgi:superfamily II DNA or RNA helicase
MTTMGELTEGPQLQFELGTIILDRFDPDTASKLQSAIFDRRTNQYRARARAYRSLVLELRDANVKYCDSARTYQTIICDLQRPIEPRTHQAKALQAWLDSGKVGIVSLPTGAGKTILAVLAIAQAKRSTLVVVPTIDLLYQWQEILQNYLGGPIGCLGGGHRELQPITVATYDSAYLTMPHYGGKFGLVVFDECHHLPATQYQEIANMAIAPFRLGLSATLERSDGREELLTDLIGPVVYTARIDEMVTKVLSPYDVVAVEVPLTEAESKEYQSARAIYTAFVRRAGIDFGTPRGWTDFIMRASRSPDGREAMAAYRRQKQLANAASGKLAEIWNILQRHFAEQILIFTSENAFAYEIGKSFIVPVITHQTRPKERKAMLEAFKTGEIRVLATSRVLNEGVDVPEASVGVVVSGTGTVREHVQRLGRVLRFRPGKRAVLYEITSLGTAEKYVSQRRRQHHAYKGTSQA